MSKTHHYEVEVTWSGSTDNGSTKYWNYKRDHEINGLGVVGKPSIPGSADPAFRGAPERWNPEELLVASLSQCHMLWYLALCAQTGITVTRYRDRPSGTMLQTPDGSGAFSEVVLRPQVTVALPESSEKAAALHAMAHQMCFIANSVNFTVRCEPNIRVQNPG